MGLFNDEWGIGDCHRTLYNDSLFTSHLQFRAAARNLEYLGLLGVTHVLNTAEGSGARMTVNTSQEYYSPAGMMLTLSIVEQMCELQVLCTWG